MKPALTRAPIQIIRQTHRTGIVDTCALTNEDKNGLTGDKAAAATAPALTTLKIAVFATDAEGKHEHGDERKPWLLQHLPERESEIFDHCRR